MYQLGGAAPVLAFVYVFPLYVTRTAEQLSPYSTTDSDEVLNEEGTQTGARSAKVVWSYINVVGTVVAIFATLAVGGRFTSSADSYRYREEVKLSLLLS